jgi:undecaprenyl-diphosphatase
MLPYRARPILNPNFNFTFELDKFSYLNTWSSLPSDHAVLFFSLATGTYLISKKWGIISFAYVIIFISFPRIYLGFHYLTDIIAGAGIGILITCIISCQKTIQLLSKKTLALSIKFPGVFYACFFILSYQIASMFEQTRAIASFLITLMK